MYTTIMQYAACRDFVDAETYVRGAMDFNALVAGLFDRDGDLIPACADRVVSSWGTSCMRRPALTAGRAERIESVVRTFRGTTVYDAYFKAHCAGVRGDSGAAIAKQKAADAVARVIKDQWPGDLLEQWRDKLGIVNAMAHHTWYVNRKYMDKADSLGDCMERRATALIELSLLIDKIERETDKVNRK